VFRARYAARHCREVGKALRIVITQVTCVNTWKACTKTNFVSCVRSKMKKTSASLPVSVSTSLQPVNSDQNRHLTIASAFDMKRPWHRRKLVLAQRARAPQISSAWALAWPSPPPPIFWHEKPKSVQLFSLIVTTLTQHHGFEVLGLAMS
jgi:hypothetical protein